MSINDFYRGLDTVCRKWKRTREGISTYPCRDRRSHCGSVTLGEKQHTVLFFKTLAPLRYLDCPLHGKVTFVPRPSPSASFEPSHRVVGAIKNKGHHSVSLKWARCSLPQAANKRVSLMAYAITLLRKDGKLALNSLRSFEPSRP